jgi:hypothetical protein
VPLDIRGRIEEAYQQRGYPTSTRKVRPYQRDENGRVELVFDVAPGPRVTIARVKIRGNKKTKKKAVLENVELRPGEVYDVREVRETFRELYKTGLFRRVKVEVHPATTTRASSWSRSKSCPSTESSPSPATVPTKACASSSARARTTSSAPAARSTAKPCSPSARARLVVGISDRKLFGTSLEGSWSVFEEFRDEPSFEQGGARLGRVGCAASSKTHCACWRCTAGVARRSPNATSPIRTRVAAIQDVDISSIALDRHLRRPRQRGSCPARATCLKRRSSFADSAIGSELDFLRLKLSQATLPRAAHQHRARSCRSATA